MQSDNRPLSPHLQIYRLPLTAITSITHRLTGVLLGVGSLGLVYWLVALASGPEAFAAAQAAAGSVIGQIVMILFSLALFYHLANGIRHLFWDAGYGFELETAHRTGQAVIVAAVVLTLMAWIIGYSVGGA